MQILRQRINALLVDRHGRLIDEQIAKTFDPKLSIPLISIKSIGNSLHAAEGQSFYLEIANQICI